MVYVYSLFLNLVCVRNHWTFVEINFEIYNVDYGRVSDFYCYFYCIWGFFSHFYCCHIMNTTTMWMNFLYTHFFNEMQARCTTHLTEQKIRETIYVLRISLHNLLQPIYFAMFSSGAWRGEKHNTLKPGIKLSQLSHCPKSIFIQLGNKWQCLRCLWPYFSGIGENSSIELLFF